MKGSLAGGHETEADAALIALLRWLDAAGYRFVTPTPATIARVVARPDKRFARDLRDLFGWSLPADVDKLPVELRSLLARGEVIAESRSRYRVSSLGGKLFLHAAYPTSAKDAVFFGPDTYRFVKFVRAHLAAHPPQGAIVDLGAGSGAGAIGAADLCGGNRIILVDVNPEALRLARLNAAAADVPVELVHGLGLAAVPGEIHTIIANPPFIMDGEGRAYRDGGDLLGARLSLDWAIAAMDRIAPGGQLLLYTGSAICGGRDGFRNALEGAVPPSGYSLYYEEIDPDIFGEELDRPEYGEVERIAAVGVSIRRQV